MSRRGVPRIPRHILLIAAAVAAMVLLILLFGPALLRRGEVVSAEPATAITTLAPPIAAEADVFRTAPEDVAVPPVATRRVGAHPRTLAMYRTLRAYPGAPPRIPHGLTSDEFRSASCATCHQRGGWVGRFGAYAPVTPHPEYRACQQCHVPEDVVVGIQPTSSGRDAICFQCHVPDGRTPPFRPVEWRPRQPPQIGRQAMPGSPPVIPHDLQLRGNCLACHMGVAAVAEIRTTHPERANCRQCHITVSEEADFFTRPLDGPAARTGGGP